MRRQRVVAALGGLSVTATVAGGVLLLQREDEPGSPPPSRTVVASAQPTPSMSLVPADRAGSVIARPPEVTRRPAAQPPGTVRLPEGGTAQLVRREVTADGTLPIPDGLEEATWWGAKLGAARGAALLAGHVNWAGRTGPFEELWRARRGQSVTVVDARGGRWVYRVTDVLTVHKTRLPAHAQRLFAQDGPHRLVLVTCGGDYVGGTDGYEDNRIVTAALVTRP
ncbi:class F sortase [Prauserella muralis]|uniref:Sortase n=1 Tax=Prauserella muralis TaxID=588067 RepID=A0A2V4B0V4_9PSEU|nr:class F sortase [Prauserella muralis]PXY27653.1 sortase [Prauserella muralis]TWE22612.1 sortase family protein [Prauserella muralis]